MGSVWLAVPATPAMLVIEMFRAGSHWMIEATDQVCVSALLSLCFPFPWVHFKLLPFGRGRKCTDSVAMLVCCMKARLGPC